MFKKFFQELFIEPGNDKQLNQWLIFGTQSHQVAVQAG